MGKKIKWWVRGRSSFVLIFLVLVIILYHHDLYSHKVRDNHIKCICKRKQMWRGWVSLKYPLQLTNWFPASTLTYSTYHFCAIRNYYHFSVNLQIWWVNHFFHCRNVGVVFCNELEVISKYQCILSFIATNILRRTVLPEMSFIGHLRVSLLWQNSIFKYWG